MRCACLSDVRQITHIGGQYRRNEGIKKPGDEPPGFAIESARIYFFLAGVAQQALVVVLAAGVLQQEVQVSFFFARMQWPLAQLLSRRLVETRARVRRDFMRMWCGCLETGRGRLTCAQNIRAEIKRVISGNLKNY